MSRKLLIVYLGGGVDAHALMTPRRGTNRSAYLAARGSLAQADQPAYALNADWHWHPAMSELTALYRQGRVAVVMNTGPLVVPTTRAQYEKRSVPLPQALSSHSDQNRTWQIGDASDTTGDSGWVGRMMAALPESLRGGSFSPMTSTAGPQPALVAPGLRALGLGPEGVTPRHASYITSDVVQMMEGVMRRSGSLTHPLARAFGEAQQRSADNSVVVEAALETVTDDTTYTSLPELKTVARLFKSDAVSGRSRAVHFAVQGGYDSHSNQNEILALKLAELDAGIGAFWRSARALGIQDEVSMLIYSEFGRSLVPNNSGTDHGWGGHALLIGPVLGGLHGKAPDLRLTGPDMVESRGLMLPSTPTEHLLVEVARWMGVPASSMTKVFPNLNAFPISSGLGGLLGGKPQSSLKLYS